MNFYDHSPTLLVDRQSISGRRNRVFSLKLSAAALTLILLGFSANVFAQPIKIGYAALSAGQIGLWLAKDGGYLSKYGVDTELIYIPAVAATQALIAGEIQLAQVT